MDEMKLKLSTKFMKSIITKLISKALLKKFGYKIDIGLQEIEMEMKDGKVRLHTNVDVEMNSDDFMKLIKSIGLD